MIQSAKGIQIARSSTVCSSPAASFAELNSAHRVNTAVTTLSGLSRTSAGGAVIASISSSTDIGLITRYGF
jgi:hypothetical protein